MYDLPRVGTAEQVTSPPYDVINDEQQQRYRAKSPYNAVHLEFNDKGADSQTRQTLYRHSAALLSEWRSQGVLARDEEPFYYPYRMDFDLGGARRAIRGLICAVDIESWGGSVIPHERIIATNVNDRLGLLREVKANLSPVYAVFSGPVPELEALFDSLGDPLTEVEDHEGVRHSMWRCRDTAISEWLADEALLIADGHHRYTTALQFRDEMRDLHGSGPWDQIMMLVVDSTTQDPPVLPIHRLVSGASLPAPETPAGDLQSMLASLSDDPPSVGIASMTGGALSMGSLALTGDPPAVVALHESILDPASADLTFTADAQETLDAVRSGASESAVFLPPTTTARIREVIDRGERMPQKSTFFWPKPRTGMVIRSLDPPLGSPVLPE